MVTLLPKLEKKRRTKAKFCSCQINVYGSFEAYIMPFVWPPIFDCRKLRAQWTQNILTEQAKLKVSNACTDIACIYVSSTYMHT